MIKSFPNRAILNPGGLAAFYFIPYYKVIQISPAINGRLSEPLKLAKDANFLKGYATSESLKFTEKTNKTDNGPYYTQSLQGNYPGDPGEVQAIFQEMESLGNQFLVIFQDILGRRRLAGYAGALEFESNYDSETKRYTYSFSGDTLEKAPIYPFSVVF